MRLDVGCSIVCTADRQFQGAEVRSRSEDLAGQVTGGITEAVLRNFDSSIADGTNPNAELLIEKAVIYMEPPRPAA
jgi:hypothetical protein